MDVSMPFMGGMEATELIRAYEMHADLQPIPIVALTAHASTYFLDFDFVEIHNRDFSDRRQGTLYAGGNGTYCQRA